MKQQRSQFRAIRGVRDILPPESALWNRVEQTARAVFAAYNFQEIRLPIFEETELFCPLGRRGHGHRLKGDVYLCKEIGVFSAKTLGLSLML